MRFALGCLLLVACQDRAYFYDLEALPVEEFTGGLPVEGEGGLLVWLAREDGDWSNVVGFARFRCDDCRLGDGIAKLTIAGFPDGIPFSVLRLGEVTAALDFADGEVTLVSRWRSEDFVLAARVVGTLAHDADDIALRGCVRFAATEALRRRDPQLHALVTLTGAPRDAREVFSIEIGGTLGQMRRLGRECSLAQVR